MTSMLSKIIIFITGAALGSVITWRLLQKQYDERVNEEMMAFKKAQRDEKMEKLEQMHADLMEKKEELRVYETTVNDHHDEPHEEPTSQIEKNGKTTSEHYRGLLDEMGYNADEPEPYVISPEEFGDNVDDYELVSLNYYEDGVLADDWDEPIEDIDKVVGKDSLTHFGEYEDDSVYVRNDRLKCEYEILMRVGKFADKIKNDSSEVEG